MVFEIRRPALWVPEAVNYARGNNGILHCLIDFLFQVLGQIKVIADGSRRMNKILKTRQLFIRTSGYIRTFSISRIAVWPFVGSSDNLRCCKSFEIWTRAWICDLGIINVCPSDTTAMDELDFFQISPDSVRQIVKFRRFGEGG